ncbi:hypothetical protein ACL02O_22985 [Micromonospora sp. MS34]|uniref:hypothetical protein n=1 Tax=Micromonospora sp. MS34 TaxID=3385971 RepID=UPI0039A2A0FA
MRHGRPRIGRIVAAPVGLLLVGAATAGCGTGSEQVEARLVDGRLSLHFERVCPVGMLTLTDPARRSSTASAATDAVPPAGPTPAATAPATAAAEPAGSQPGPSSAVSVEPSVSPGWPADPGTWWQIRTPRVGSFRDLASVVAGEPVEGFDELVDRTGGELPRRLSLSVKNAVGFDADIDVAELADGRPHRYPLHQVWAELFPSDRC